MNRRKLVKLEKRLPQRAVAALDAAHQRAVASGLPLVLVIGDSLYRVNPSGEKEFIHALPPRLKVSGRRKRSKA
ncbi:MAG: hypothetical protein ACJ8F7_22090 [Gemmataceae bacterium]